MKRGTTRSWRLELSLRFSGSMLLPMTWIRRLLAGGSAGNGHLTAVIAAVLLVLLAIEGATLAATPTTAHRPRLRRDAADPRRRAEAREHGLAHAPLLPWRRRVRRSGPPPLMSRARRAGAHPLDACALCDGYRATRLGQTEGTLVGLHKASFIVWFGAAAVLLAHVSKLPRLLRTRAAGLGLRIALVIGAVAAGLVLAIATLPAADQLQDRVSAHVRLDAD